MTILQLKYAIAVSDSHSMSEAATKLYVSQPGLSSAIRDLENEIGKQLFQRVHQGVVTTPDGDIFIAYARMAVEQFEQIENKYIEKKEEKQTFSVSMQHYTFAVNAFINTIKKFDTKRYHYSIRETQTNEVINDLRNFRSEVGVIAISDFNRQMLKKLFCDYHLEFVELFHCNTYIYLWENHPLAGKKELSLHELEEYPCLVFDQGGNNSFYFREEAHPTYDYKKLISTNERATSMELLIGLNGYAVGSGLLNDNLINQEYVAVKLKQNETLTLGYLIRQGKQLSPIAKQYIEELEKSSQNE